MKRYFTRLGIILAIALALLIAVCVLFALGIEEEKYFQTNYLPVEATVYNLTIKKEHCSEFIGFYTKPTYKGYINIRYDINNTRYYSIFTHDRYCSSNYALIMEYLINDYNVNEDIYIWYYIFNPNVWVFQKPLGEIFLISSLSVFFLFLFAVYIGIIYLIRDKDYLTDLLDTT